MRNSFISIVLFTTLLIFLYNSNNKLNSICEHILATCENTEILIDSGDWKKSYKDTVALIDYIKENKASIAMFVNHAEFDNLNIEAAKLSQYIEFENSEESLASLHAIKFSANCILELQKINIENLF